MSGSFWFNGWESLGRIVAYSLVSYVLLIALVRWFGNRTISKMNPSDFVVTIAVGSIVANWVLQSPVSLVDGVVAITMILGLQTLTEFLTTHSDTVRKLSEGSPILLAYHGRLLHDVMTREHVNDHELLESLRRHGVGTLEDVEAVVLEIDGSFSVLRRGERVDALRDVKVN